MKKLPLLILAGILMLFAYSCNNNIYSELLKAERKLIEAYIQNEGIIVVDTIPSEWGEKVYYKDPQYDNFYFHLAQQGDTTQEELATGETVLLRFKRYTLDEYSDTLYNWSTMDSPEPIKMQYQVTSNNSCTGWHVALKYMKYTDSQCKIICPSKMGFSEENSSVTPYGYDLKIKIKRY